MSERTDADLLLSAVRVYDFRGLLPVKTPPDDEAENIDANLQAAVSKQSLKKYEIRDAKPGSECELFLKCYVHQYSNPKRWGHEFHVVLPVGRSAKGRPAPLGRIIMRWTRAGDCTARIISDFAVTVPDPSATETKLTVDKLTELLRVKLGMAVKSRGKDWTAAELALASMALLRVPEKDWAALDGVDLVRMPTVEGAEQDTDLQFSRDQRFDQVKVLADSAELRVGDGAFTEDDSVFVGTDPGGCLPASCKKILHEVGHAVETAGRRRAVTKQMNAGAELNRVSKELNELKKAGKQGTEAQWARHDQAKQRYDDAQKALTAARGKDRSVPLDRFVNHVINKGINRRLTEHAGDSWPGQPQELYADAYALWLLDREFLTGFSPDLVSFFTSGAYQPPA